MVGVIRCMGRSLGIAGELSGCALFIFSSGLAAFGCSTFAYISIFFRCCICQTPYNSWVNWPGAPTFKFPPARSLVQGAVADNVRHGVLRVGPGALSSNYLQCG